MLSEAHEWLSQGRSVILDATFREAAWRQKAFDLTKAHDCDWQGLWLRLDQQTRLNRVNERSNDASDATLDIALQQTEVQDLGIGWQAQDVAIDLQKSYDDPNV